MGYTELWVAGANLCAHLEEGEIVEGAHWYLLPLLEWLVANWNALLHEERLPIRNVGRDAVEALYLTRFPRAHLSSEEVGLDEDAWFAWRERHARQTAREGGLLPDVCLRRFRDQVEIAWSDSPPIGAPDDFAFLVPRGRALVDTELVASALHSVLTAAVEQLRIWNDASVRLDALGKAAKALKRPRLQRAARLDWLFDLGAGERGFGSSWEDLRALFRGAPAKVRRALFEPEGGSGLFLRGSSHAVLLFGCVDPNISHSDARTLAEALIALFDEDGDSEALLDLVAGCSWRRPAGFALGARL